MSPTRTPSYLLVLNGSHEAKEAAEFAWGLSANNKAKIVAQQVIDVPAIWQFLRFTLPGLVGSGVYFEAEKKIAETLRSVAETVALSYTAQAEGHGVDIASFVDEGDTIEEICQRAFEHDLIIVGRLENYDFGPQIKDATRLVDKCRKPIVFVNGQSGSELINISISNRELNPDAVESVIQYAKSASIPLASQSVAVAR